MTNAVAVLLADGCEEIEALTVVDVLRRLAIPVATVALGDQLVTGGHGIKIQADTTWHDQLTAAPLVVLPGGRGGRERLRDDERGGGGV
uniref:DJ-1/PfpI family protein n=1 Tax=Limosilactobacillus equigenerosi TaxID=417373 RepID=UPI000B14ED0E